MSISRLCGICSIRVELRQARVGHNLLLNSNQLNLLAPWRDGLIDREAGYWCPFALLVVPLSVGLSILVPTSTRRHRHRLDEWDCSYRNRLGRASS
jgi:hypothetical protein